MLLAYMGNHAQMHFYTGSCNPQAAQHSTLFDESFNSALADLLHPTTAAGVPMVPPETSQFVHHRPSLTYKFEHE